MNRKIIGFGAAVAALGLATALTATPALAAVEDGTWGIWSAANVDDAPTGELTFGNVAVGGASYVWTNAVGTTGYPYIESTTSKGDWIDASTAIGGIFGANGPSDVENMIILDASDVNTGTLAVTFDHAVPANYLGVAIIDIDSTNADDIEQADRVTVEAAADDASDLTTDELNGNVFNMCDVPVNADMPSNCGDTPNTMTPDMTESSPVSLYFTANLTDSSDDGDSAWLNPTKDVKNLNITWSSVDIGSSIRVMIAVKQDPALPNTGLDVTTGALSALLLGTLGAIAVAATRRRNA